MNGPYLVAGLGVSGRAVVRALVARGQDVVTCDDHRDDTTATEMEALGVSYEVAPAAGRVDELVRGAGAVLPAYSLPDGHPVLVAAARAGRPVLSELDLAAAWDERPRLAVTGTDGKTTVTTLVQRMLEADGRSASVAGNADVPLVAAIDDPTIEVFVVEASSFRLGRSQRFAPDVGTWLNFAPDHLDVHADLTAYEAAKARIWRDQRPDQVAVGNADDPVVERHLSVARARQVRFGSATGDYRVVDRVLVASDRRILGLDEMPRRLPHDVANALAAAATVIEFGVGADAVATVLRSFRGLPHRVELVREVGGVRWFDDSKATVPHAALTAIRGFESVVLVAGGRNKGLDLGELREAAGHLKAVVALGEAAEQVRTVFDGLVPVQTVETMGEAVAAAAMQVEPGDVVLLSPACASFDQYRDYGARGDDFAAHVRSLREEAAR